MPFVTTPIPVGLMAVCSCVDEFPVTSLGSGHLSPELYFLPVSSGTQMTSWEITSASQWLCKLLSVLLNPYFRFFLVCSLHALLLPEINP